MRDKILNTVSFIVLGAVAILVIIVFWDLFIPFEVVSVNQPFKILNPNHTVQSGEGLRYQSNYCKYINSVASVSYALWSIDGRIILLEPTYSNAPAGCGTVQRNISIPDSIPSQTYTLHVDTQYQVNVIRTVIKHYVTEPFYVQSK